MGTGVSLICDVKDKRRLSSSAGLVHTTLEEFEIDVSTLKTHQIISVHTALKEFGNATIIDHSGFAFEEHPRREITGLSWFHRFLKAPFSKGFPLTLKRKARWRFQIPPV